MIVVDSREPWEEVFEKLSDLGAEHRLEALNGPEHPKTDYLVADEKLAIQRKEVNDFVSSLDTLKDDLFKLREAHELSALLIEGSWGTAGSRIALRRGRTHTQTVPVSTWHNFIVSQQMRGTMFLRTNSLNETCRVLVSLDGYVEGSMSPPVNAPEDPFTMLQVIPGIGPETAHKLEDEFGSPYEALVNIGKWTSVDGIGPKTEETAIRWFKES